MERDLAPAQGSIRTSAPDPALLLATVFSVAAAAGRWWRHHLHESVPRRAVRAALIRAWIPEPAGCHTLRCSFAAHVLNRGGKGVRSPMDAVSCGLGRDGGFGGVDRSAWNRRLVARRPLK